MPKTLIFLRLWLSTFQDEYVDSSSRPVSLSTVALVLLRCSDGDHCDQHLTVSSGDNIGIVSNIGDNIVSTGAIGVIGDNIARDEKQCCPHLDCHHSQCHWSPGLAQAHQVSRVVRHKNISSPLTGRQWHKRPTAEPRSFHHREPDWMKYLKPPYMPDSSKVSSEIIVTRLVMKYFLVRLTKVLRCIETFNVTFVCLTQMLAVMTLMKSQDNTQISRR